MVRLGLAGLQGLYHVKYFNCISPVITHRIPGKEMLLASIPILQLQVLSHGSPDASPSYAAVGGGGEAAVRSS